MRPDLVILNKRVRETTSRHFEEREIENDLSYQQFFSSLERKLAPFFTEQNAKLSYKGRNAGVFPSNLFWGAEVLEGEGNVFSRRGEIDILFEGQKVGGIRLEFSMRRGSVALVKEPRIGVVEY